MGLTRRIVDSLLKENIRTVGGFVGRSKKELKRLLNLSPVEADELVEKTNALADTMPAEPIDTEADMEAEEERIAASLPDLGGDDDIVGTLSHYFGYEKDEIESHTRRANVVKVRDLIIYLLREYGDMSYPGIGRLLDRDHTTIIHAYKKVKKNVQERPEMEAGLTEIIGKVKEIKERKLRIEESLIPEIFGTTEIDASQGTAQVFQEIPERNAKVLELYRDGLTLGNIGQVIGVSRERVRQIVAKTIRQVAINESLEKGIVMDSEVLAEEESKKRKKAQDTKREASKPKKTSVDKNRWSRYYTECQSCGTTAIPHVRKGLCEQCIGQFRAERREDIIDRHGNKCDSCGRTRYEATALFGRDFYITKDRQVFCKECFSLRSGKILGSYRNYEWSRHYERCLKCGTTEVPHVKKGLCENCTDVLTDERRERTIQGKGSRCGHCYITRLAAQKKYKKDLFVIRTGETLCRVCFQKYAKGGMRTAKRSKQAKTR